MLRTACLILALGVASCQLAEKAAAWPKDPVGDPASLLFRQLQARLGVKEEMIVDATPQRRILKGQSAVKEARATSGLSRGSRTSLRQRV